MKVRKIICDILGIMVEYDIEQVYKNGFYHLTIRRVVDIIDDKEHRSYDGLRTRIVEMIEMHNGIRIYNILK